MTRSRPSHYLARADRVVCFDLLRFAESPKVAESFGPCRIVQIRLASWQAKYPQIANELATRMKRVHGESAHASMKQRVSSKIRLRGGLAPKLMD